MIDAYEDMQADTRAPSKRTQDALMQIVSLYATWDAAEPGKGYDAKSAEWRAKLPPTDEAAEPAP